LNNIFESTYSAVQQQKRKPLVPTSTPINSSQPALQLTAIKLSATKEHQASNKGKM